MYYAIRNKKTGQLLRVFTDTEYFHDYNYTRVAATLETPVDETCEPTIWLTSKREAALAVLAGKARGSIDEPACPSSEDLNNLEIVRMQEV